MKEKVSALLDGALDDGQGLGIQQFVLVCLAQQLQQLLAIFRFMGKSLGKLAQPGLLLVTRSVFAHGV